MLSKAPGTVFDIEANGLNPSRIHCLSARVNGKIRTTSREANYRSFCSKNILVGHNIIRYDIPVLKRLAKIEPQKRVVDTLALSWYLYPDMPRHGLADWGEEFGIPKPEVYDWENEPIEVYEERCEEDVKINSMLWDKQWAYLLKLYGSEEEAWRLIDYLTFKMDCAREQEEVRWRVDVERAVMGCEELSKERDAKVEALIKVMPKVRVLGLKKPPAKPFKKDGSRSVSGQNWVDFLASQALEPDHKYEVMYCKEYKEPNPNSPNQVKDWLYALGWKPETFKYVRDKETNEFRKIPQVRKDSELCPSVLKLDHEGIILLEGLTVLNHRIGILEGFIEYEEYGYLKAEIGGLTNTLRFKHKKPLVNLPGVHKPYGELIRGCLIAPDGYELTGTDMCSLEDNTKQHYMFPHDPDYVEEMRREDYDPHLSLAVSDNALTEAQSDAHKSGEESHSGVRRVYKQVNYACVYGAGGATVGRSAGVSKHRGNALVDAYWLKNWSVRTIADECVTKTCNYQRWLFNPVSKLWYSLRAEKDRFSTLNQGTGVYCFDTWVKHCRNGGPPIIGQFHDETISLIKKDPVMRARVERFQRRAMEKTNEELQLNVTLDIDVQFGGTYAGVH